MKNAIMICIVLGGIVTELLAQPDGKMNTEKMKIFAFWSGKWQGVSAMQMGPGDPKKADVDEVIQYKLGGTILLIEGIGTAKDEQTQEEAVVHHAVGILSYDLHTSEYKFRSYLKTGQSTDAWFTVTAENKYTWGFEAPNVKMRYFITIDPIQNTWHEIGEFSRDGTNWIQVFEMNLKKME